MKRVFNFPENSGLPVFCSTKEQRADIFEKLKACGYVPKIGLSSYDCQLNGVIISGNKIDAGTPDANHMFTYEQLISIIQRWDSFEFDAYSNWTPSHRSTVCLPLDESKAKDIIKKIEQHGLKVYDPLPWHIGSPVQLSALSFNSPMQKFIPEEYEFQIKPFIIPTEDFIQLIEWIPSKELIQKIDSLKRV